MYPNLVTELNMARRAELHRVARHDRLVLAARRASRDGEPRRRRAR